MIEAKNFTASEKTCEDNNSKNSYSSRIICADESYSLIQHLPNKTISKGLWLKHGGYMRMTKNGTQIVERQKVQDELLPSICMVSQKGMSGDYLKVQM